MCVRGKNWKGGVAVAVVEGKHRRCLWGKTSRERRDNLPMRSPPAASRAILSGEGTATSEEKRCSILPFHSRNGVEYYYLSNILLI